MDTVTGGAVDLEALYGHDHHEQCNVHDHEQYGETCSVTARWASYVRPECNVRGFYRGLWCDVRHRTWVDDVERGARCLCGLPQSHWRVVPL